MIVKKVLPSLFCIITLVLVIIFSFTLGAVSKLYSNHYTINTAYDIISALAKQGVIRKHAYIEYHSKLLIPTGLGYLNSDDKISKLFYITELDNKYVMCLLDVSDVNTFSADITDYNIKGISRKFDDEELLLIKDILVNDYGVHSHETDKFVFEYMLDDTVGENLFFVRLAGLVLLAVILFIIGINVLEVKKCLMSVNGRSQNE